MITSKLFEAFLACPTKCYLQSIGEVAPGNDYAIWQEARSESYRLNGIQQLLADNSKKICAVPADPCHWRRESWHFALAPFVRMQDIEATPHAVRRLSPRQTAKSIAFVPVRYLPENKLSKSHKLVAAFDALVISSALGERIGTATIIHGDKGSVFTVKAHALSSVIRKTVGQIAALMSASSPPNLILNRHCPECGFQDLCRKKAVEKNELTLLANLPAKERVRLNRKGIFTVSQLSFTFRPRRRIKRLAAKPEKYHHSLKALVYCPINK